ncbi:hypothetical protein GCM10009555_068870 [Acrocarpospora macrocephala]|uniref:H repeat-associated protein N-terminal domain-containing protein n=1 Tax=Acrocarpospora macrocephala TaxID=150177 RepID=A0A5M3X2S0_9ACTN|nr:hypothetical protein Amac_096350 [Acrocarpospora macrocephala]
MDITDLRQAWAQIPHPRSPGPARRPHPLIGILALVQAAIVSGAVCQAAIRHAIPTAPSRSWRSSKSGATGGPAATQAPSPDTVDPDRPLPKPHPPIRSTRV